MTYKSYESFFFLFYGLKLHIVVSLLFGASFMVCGQMIEFFFAIVQNRNFHGVL